MRSLWSNISAYVPIWPSSAKCGLQSDVHGATVHGPLTLILPSRRLLFYWPRRNYCDLDHRDCHFPIPASPFPTSTPEHRGSAETSNSDTADLSPQQAHQRKRDCLVSRGQVQRLFLLSASTLDTASRGTERRRPSAYGVAPRAPTAPAFPDEAPTRTGSSFRQRTSAPDIVTC